ncbi:MAG TPA: response regulator transcription factor [Candidatus Merdicola faecigallinarum]|uniref:Stage 0 sporulation protein A homolog n=1 Tax=Candidatus Merdicola faecigallinarum TaxID=2840862 RepID=A0A9D1S9G6_9FIRM|nr:response regulator transcription factor [Candidatus Merdicola faecigallinarum]
MKKILIVEDNIDIHNLIKEILENKKYKVIDSYSGTEAFMVLEKEKIDLILLDLMLPGLNGEEIIKKVKEIPIIVISAKLTPESKVNALLSGANDYITKPFNPQELLARIEVQLRIYQNTIQTSNRDIKYKDLLLKEDEHVIYLKEEKIYLTKTEYAILKQLLLNPNKIVTKSRLLELISNDTLDGDENSLKVHISNIRKKMRKISQEEYIESVWGIGFKIY